MHYGHPVIIGHVPHIQQESHLLFVPAPLDLLIVNMRLEIDRRVRTGAAGETALPAAKRLPGPSVPG